MMRYNTDRAEFEDRGFDYSDPPIYVSAGSGK